MPRVSVIIPTFNCGRFLGRTIDSALAQRYTDYEIIVADDGSTDETRDLVTQYDGRVHYLYQPNRGASSARNLALSKANGEFIAYLDADDMWCPQKLERQVAFLDAHKECGLVHSDFAVIDEADNVIRLRSNRENGTAVSQGLCVMDLLRGCGIRTLSVVERRDCIERAGNFDDRIESAQDYYHWILVAMEGVAFGYLDEPLAIYRRRAGSLSSSQRRVFEDLAMIFGILVTERSLALRFGQEAADIVRHRLYTVRRQLAYLDRLEGRRRDSGRRVISLIRGWPSRTELYADLLKACVPPSLGVRLRVLKERFGMGGLWTLPRQ